MRPSSKKKNISVAFPYIESFFVFDTDFLSTRQNVKKNKQRQVFHLALFVILP